MQQEHDNQGELCLNGCGFFGSKANSGLCSVCWKKTMSKTTSTPSVSVSNHSTRPSSHTVNNVSTLTMKPLETMTDETTCKTTTTLSQVQLLRSELTSTMMNTRATTSTDQSSETITCGSIVGTTATVLQSALPVQKNRKRCMECNKKIGLTGIECRCGYIYCGLHRYPDQHHCTFDFKTLDRQELAKRNPGGGTFNKMERL